MERGTSKPKGMNVVRSENFLIGGVCVFYFPLYVAWLWCLGVDYAIVNDNTSREHAPLLFGRNKLQDRNCHGKRWQMVTFWVVSIEHGEVSIFKFPFVFYRRISRLQCMVEIFNVLLDRLVLVVVIFIVVLKGKFAESQTSTMRWKRGVQWSRS